MNEPRKIVDIRDMDCAEFTSPSGSMRFPFYLSFLLLYFAMGDGDHPTQFTHEPDLLSFNK